MTAPKDQSIYYKWMQASISPALLTIPKNETGVFGAIRFNQLATNYMNARFTVPFGKMIDTESIGQDRTKELEADIETGALVFNAVSGILLKRIITVDQYTFGLMRQLHHAIGSAATSNLHIPQLQELRHETGSRFMRLTEIVNEGEDIV